MTDLNVQLIIRYTSLLFDRVREEFGREDEQFCVSNVTRLTWADKGIALDIHTIGTELKVVIQAFESIDDSKENAEVLKGIVQEVGRVFGIVAKEEKGNVR